MKWEWIYIKIIIIINVYVFDDVEERKNCFTTLYNIISSSFTSFHSIDVAWERYIIAFCSLFGWLHTNDQLNIRVVELQILPIQNQCILELVGLKLLLEHWTNVRSYAIRFSSFIHIINLLLYSFIISNSIQFGEKNKISTSPSTLRSLCSSLSTQATPIL